MTMTRLLPGNGAMKISMRTAVASLGVLVLLGTGLVGQVQPAAASTTTQDVMCT